MSDFERLAQIAIAQQRQIELLRTMLFAEKAEEQALAQLRTLETLIALEGYPCETDLFADHERVELHGPLWAYLSPRDNEHLVITRVVADGPVRLCLHCQSTQVTEGSDPLTRLFLWIHPHAGFTVEARPGQLPLPHPLIVTWPPYVYGFRLYAP